MWVGGWVGVSVCGGGRGVEVRRRYTLYGDHCPPAKSGMHGTGVFQKHNGGGTYCVYILGCIHSNCNVDTGPLNLLHCRHSALMQVQPSHVSPPCSQWRLTQSLRPCLLHNGMHVANEGAPLPPTQHLGRAPDIN